ncbi:MAG: hypothetical protein GXO81_04005 [Chlorobi bacterium]|nr:hypothetical protein [Chlorobiota bacterium]
MRRRLSIGLTIIFIVFTLRVQSQSGQSQGHGLTISIPEVVMLGLEATSSKSIVLNPESPNTAGLALDFANSHNSDLWINYSSITDGGAGHLRSVTVAVTGPIPKGVDLKVSASHDAGKGKGAVGVPLGQVILSAEAQNIITGIGSCYTGAGVNNGHRLTYSLELKDPDSYAALDYGGSTGLTVIYTLTDSK